MTIPYRNYMADVIQLLAWATRAAALASSLDGGLELGRARADRISRDASRPRTYYPPCRPPPLRIFLVAGHTRWKSGCVSQGIFAYPGDVGVFSGRWYTFQHHWSRHATAGSVETQQSQDQNSHLERL